MMNATITLEAETSFVRSAMETLAKANDLDSTIGRQALAMDGDAMFQWVSVAHDGRIVVHLRPTTRLRRLLKKAEALLAAA